MKQPDDSLSTILETVRSKNELLTYVKNNPECIEPMIQLSIEHTPTAWRAAWLLGHTMHTNDLRVQKSIDKLIKTLASAKEGHQRQLIIILLKMKLNETQEGNLFDTCLNIWENIKLIPSTRVTALKFIFSIAEKFPELKSELKLWTQDMYLDSLSPGIKNSVINQVKSIL